MFSHSDTKTISLNLLCSRANLSNGDKPLMGAFSLCATSGSIRKMSLTFAMFWDDDPIAISVRWRSLLCEIWSVK